ncbi:MAG TPA: Asp-tRNA(Asn)/Glu-tRNA(Gln) amidotransferase subunit GatC [Blastocatellia bacterium]|nr:Asp-tRNA(Asn)/Glu-tRNA(Gln) amidotransferase subunit GatC [Blastocatellia bacterium]
MRITESDVEKIAELGRLELTAEETEAFTRQLGAILDYMEKLNQLDTSNVEPMSHSVTSTGDTAYTQRDDEVKPSIGQKAALENAPESELGCFMVPKVIGG